MDFGEAERHRINLYPRRSQRLASPESRRAALRSRRPTGVVAQGNRQRNRHMVTPKSRFSWEGAEIHSPRREVR
jgi:hypothetical protein